MKFGVITALPITIGFVFGGNLLFLITGVVDCSQAKHIQVCAQFTEYGSTIGIIMIILGFMIGILSLIFNEGDTEKIKKTSRSPITSGGKGNQA